MEYQGAVQSYLLGLYEPCITKAALSVEMGLIVRLTEDLSDQEKESLEKQYSYFTFGTFKKICADKNIIIPSQALDDFQRIIDIRNANIHAINTVSAMMIANKIIYDNNQELLQTYRDPQNFLEKALVKSANMLLKSYNLRNIEDVINHTHNFSNYQWCANTKFQCEIQNKFNGHISEILKNQDKNPFAIFTTLLKKRELFTPDWYHKELAQETIPLTFKLLKILNLF